MAEMYRVLIPPEGIKTSNLILEKNETETFHISLKVLSKIPELKSVPAGVQVV